MASKSVFDGEVPRMRMRRVRPNHRLRNTRVVFLHVSHDLSYVEESFTASTNVVGLFRLTDNMLWTLEKVAQRAKSPCMNHFLQWAMSHSSARHPLGPSYVSDMLHKGSHYAKMILHHEYAAALGYIL